MTGDGRGFGRLTRDGRDRRRRTGGSGRAICPSTRNRSAAGAAARVAKACRARGMVGRVAGRYPRRQLGVTLELPASVTARVHPRVASKTPSERLVRLEGVVADDAHSGWGGDAGSRRTNQESERPCEKRTSHNCSLTGGRADSDAVVFEHASVAFRLAADMAVVMKPLIAVFAKRKVVVGRGLQGFVAVGARKVQGDEGR